MNYAPPLVLLVVSAELRKYSSKTSFAKPNGGVVFWASTTWSKDGAPQLIPTAISHDAFAQLLAAMDAMRSGIAMRLFQASQQASTMSS